jgi:hypothetical protein
MAPVPAVAIPTVQAQTKPRRYVIADASDPAAATD